MKKFFQEKKYGFYVTLGLSLLMLITGIMYAVLFQGDAIKLEAKIEYNLAISLVLIIGSIVSLGALIFKYTSKYARYVAAVSMLAATCLFISDSYLFVVNCGQGIDYTMKDLLKPEFFSVALFVIVAFIASIVDCFLPQVKAVAVEGVSKKVVSTVHGVLMKTSLVVTSILMAVLLTGTKVAEENFNAISIFLKQPTFEIKDKPGSETEDTEYFKSKYHSVNEVLEKGAEVAEKIEAEGAVLLENDGTLPLAKNTKVTLVGSASEVNSFGGRGSSQTDHPEPPVRLPEGLENAGLDVNQKVKDYYRNASAQFKNPKNPNNYIEANLFEFDFAEVTENPTLYDTFGDYRTAIYVISRNGGEGNDLKLGSTVSTYATPNDTREKTAKTKLELTPREKATFAKLGQMKSEGKIDKIIVLLNSTNQISQNQFLPEYGINAVMWIGHLGITGSNSVGKLLVGEVNPSGHLPDTFYYNHGDNPVVKNAVPLTYANKKSFPEFNTVLKGTSLNDRYGRYYAYQEGIYVGYRYSETRYTDYVMKASGADNFDYSKVIYKPFGFGSSYTTFAHSNFNIVENEDTYTVTATVKNTGSVAGKDAVQVYMSKPFTSFDIERGIEKAAVELVGFAKTKLLNAGESETVTVIVNKECLRTYDRNDAKTYIVTPGDYMFTEAQDSHAAANNFLAFNGKTVADGMTENGNKDMVKSFNYKLDKETYMKSRGTGNIITNLFEEADINTYHGKDDAKQKVSNKLQFLSRTNWNKKLDNTLYATQLMVDDMVKQLNSDFIEKGVGKPAKFNPNGYGAGAAPIQLISLMKNDAGDEITFDDPIWAKFLDQLTWDEMVDIVTMGLRGTKPVPSVGKPGNLDHNGPTGLTEIFDSANGLARKNNDPDKGKTPTYYPSIPVVAATFNVEIAEEYGDILGEEGLWAGYNGFYGVGLNTHRSPFAGRNFEYWSEDPFMSGYMATAQVKAIQSHGVNCYIKHFALNDQETQRNCVHIWSNEQALREISLRPFEMAVVDGGAYNAMASFTRIGATYVPGSRPLITDFLRGELGLRGLVVTDMYNIGYEEAMFPSFLMAGTDIPDGKVDNTYFDKFKSYPSVTNQMRLAAQRIMYSTLKSNAMNGIGSNTIVVEIMPAWQKVLNGVTYTSFALFGVSVVWCITVVSMSIVKGSRKQD